MIGSYIRRTLFWMLDHVNGKPVRNALDEIERKMEHGEDSQEELASILKHAKGTVPYYKELSQMGKRLHSLSDFPVMTKADYKRDYDSFLCDTYREKKLYEMSTSGSTGTPFVVKMNTEKRKRVNAEFIYFNKITGQRLGERYMYLKTWKRKKSKLESIAQNVVAIDILRLNESVLEEIRQKLKYDRKIRSVLAYASTYEVLLSYLEGKGDTKADFHLKSIYTSSTLMPENTKVKLENLFGCPVIDRYSSQENGLLAQKSEGEDCFSINVGSYHIELLALDNDEEVQRGEVGRVVVTDLYNYAMPMIRYDTGDLATSDDENRLNLRTLKNLEGRRLDLIYDTSGNPLTPHTWSVHMRKFEQVVQWQFIQERKNDYLLKINGGEDIYAKKEFEETLKGILGKDANVKVEFHDTIPVMASGKFKNTICLYNPDEEHNG